MNNITVENIEICGTKMKLEIDLKEMFKLNMREISEVNPGETFKVGDEELIMLEHFENGTTACIRKELLSYEIIFGSDSNNFQSSNLREYLNGEYLDYLIKYIGKDSLVEFEQDLIALDGSTDYEKTNNLVSLLTYAQYCKYKNLLGKNDSYWWLMTPWSTPASGYSRCVCCVGAGGTLCSVGCGCSRGVRPVVKLKSNTLVAR